ncbi:MAG: SAM-dependent methyltransferase, partial [Pseudonocardiales bacterium]
MNSGHAKLCSSPEWAEFLATDVLPTALADCDAGEDILEIGPGYGATTARLIDLAANLTAVEIDPALAARLRERFPGVNVVDGRGEALPLPGSSFSAVFCFTMLHH